MQTLRCAPFFSHNTCNKAVLPANKRSSQRLGGSPKVEQLVWGKPAFRQSLKSMPSFPKWGPGYPAGEDLERDPVGRRGCRVLRPSGRGRTWCREWGRLARATACPCALAGPAAEGAQGRAVHAGSPAGHPPHLQPLVGSPAPRRAFLGIRRQPFGSGVMPAGRGRSEVKAPL